ncbi:MAG TPA: TIGR03618 family F420-dependent PPOX class oxidoreductase [Candidatus Limnocylindrales bacterium]
MESHRDLLGEPGAEEIRDFLASELRFATIATIGADGSPYQVVVWYVLEGNEMVINAAEQRVWPANLRRDPRASVLVEDGERWASVEGSVELIDDQPIAQADAAEGARLYHADDPEFAEALIHDRFEHQRRVSIRLPLARSRLVETDGTA